MIMASSWNQPSEESLIGKAKAHGLFPGVEKSPRECLAGDGDGSRVLEPDAGANSHLCTDAFAIGEVFLEERSRLLCDVAGVPRASNASSSTRRAATYSGSGALAPGILGSFHLLDQCFGFLRSASGTRHQIGHDLTRRRRGHG
jgi:hypothetical protein